MIPQPLTEEQRRIACAERIGWVHCIMDVSTDQLGLIGQVPKEKQEWGYEWDNIPDPEHSPADALALVEWMDEHGFMCVLDNDNASAENGDTIRQWTCSFQNGSSSWFKEFTASAPTFCAAIVLAFLAATEGEEKE